MSNEPFISIKRALYFIQTHYVFKEKGPHSDEMIAVNENDACTLHLNRVCYSVLRCDLVLKLGGRDSCGSVLLSVAVGCSVLHYLAVQCIAVRCSAVCCTTLQCSVLQYVAV